MTAFDEFCTRNFIHPSAQYQPALITLEMDRDSNPRLVLDAPLEIAIMIAVTGLEVRGGLYCPDLASVVNELDLNNDFRTVPKAKLLTMLQPLLQVMAQLQSLRAVQQGDPLPPTITEVIHGGPLAPAQPAPAPVAPAPVEPIVPPQLAHIPAPEVELMTNTSRLLPLSSTIDRKLDSFACTICHLTDNWPLSSVALTNQALPPQCIFRPVLPAVHKPKPAHSNHSTFPSCRRFSRLWTPLEFRSTATMTTSWPRQFWTKSSISLCPCCSSSIILSSNLATSDVASCVQLAFLPFLPAESPKSIKSVAPTVLSEPLLPVWSRTSLSPLFLNDPSFLSSPLSFLLLAAFHTVYGNTPVPLSSARPVKFC
jgi:hypothetical protein